MIYRQPNYLLSLEAFSTRADRSALQYVTTFFDFLGAQYGVSLNFDKPISSIMNKLPLIVDESSPIELVSQLAMNRKKTKLYDYIIIVNSEGLFMLWSLFRTCLKRRGDSPVSPPPQA